MQQNFKLYENIFEIFRYEIALHQIVRLFEIILFVKKLTGVFCKHRVRVMQKF